MEVLHSESSFTNKLRKLFCRYGQSGTIVTDNGPQFLKHTGFSCLLREFGVKPRKVTPYQSAANGEVELFNRNLKNCIQTTIADGENWSFLFPEKTGVLLGVHEMVPTWLRKGDMYYVYNNMLTFLKCNQVGLSWT